MGPSKPCPKYQASRALGLPAVHLSPAKLPRVGAVQSYWTSEAGVLTAWNWVGRGTDSLRLECLRDSALWPGFLVLRHRCHFSSMLPLCHFTQTHRGLQGKGCAFSLPGCSILACGLCVLLYYHLCCHEIKSA